MSILRSMFGKSKEEKIENQQEVYRKFLMNYGQNPKHEYLKELTIEAGQAYYALLNKKGTLTEADEQAIQEDMKKAVEENERVKNVSADEEELRKIYEQFLANEANAMKH